MIKMMMMAALIKNVTVDTKVEWRETMLVVTWREWEARLMESKKQVKLP